MESQTATRKLTTKEMLMAIAFYSDNELCASIARRILVGTTTVAEQLKRNPGSFIRAVLEEDFESALRSADSGNKKALERFLREVQ